MAYVLTSRRRGLGSPTGSQYISAVGSGLETTGGLLAATGVGAIPGAIVAAAGALASIIASFGVGSGCGQTCIQSSNFANQANAALQQNIEAYFSLPTPRAMSAQAAALANFDQFWSWLTSSQACGNPSLGAAGSRCISDRQSGACTWKQPASSVPPWGTPPAGSCWNWFNGYRDPIANDTNVYDDSVAAQLASAVSGSGSASGSGSSTPSGLSNLVPLLIAGGLLALAVAA